MQARVLTSTGNTSVLKFQEAVVVLVVRAPDSLIGYYRGAKPSDEQILLTGKREVVIGWCREFASSPEITDVFNRVTYVNGKDCTNDAVCILLVDLPS